MIRISFTLMLLLLASCEGAPICELHHVPMRRGWVPVRYGLILEVASPTLGQAASTQFPNANSFEWGGCTIDDTPESTQESQTKTFFCKACREAEKVWLSDHPLEDLPEFQFHPDQDSQPVKPVTAG